MHRSRLCCPMMLTRSTWRPRSCRSCTAATAGQLTCRHCWACDLDRRLQRVRRRRPTTAPILLVSARVVRHPRPCSRCRRLTTAPPSRPRAPCLPCLTATATRMPHRPLPPAPPLLQAPSLSDHGCSGANCGGGLPAGGQRGSEDAAAGEGCLRVASVAPGCGLTANQRQTRACDNPHPSGPAPRALY